MSSIFQKLLIVGLIGFALLGGAGAFYVIRFLNSPGAAESREVVYEVVPGRSFGAIAAHLESQGVIQNQRAFSIYARLTGQRSQIKAGEYLFRTSMKPHEVIHVLTSGRSIARSFTISEGLNMFEIAQIYERAGFGRAAEFLKLVRDPVVARSLLGEQVSSLEGYLFPETYQVTKFTTTRELITAMVQRFLTVYREIEASVPPGMSRHQLVTFASLVEKETGAPEERPLIASVFYNRLKKGMRLQTDPTIIYGMALERGVIPTNIGKADILRPTPYNTYVISGLPPGPISNPGREALRATIQPAQSEFLFFVSRNNGTHVFSKSYEDHNQAVRDFQMNPKARAGKSWRDLKRTSP